MERLPRAMFFSFPLPMRQGKLNWPCLCCFFFFFFQSCAPFIAFDFGFKQHSVALSRAEVSE